MCGRLDQAGLVGTELIFVVVQKKTNARFGCEGGPVPGGKGKGKGKAGGLGNVFPGTVIDTGITDKQGFDFYMVSQFGLQGTCRPSHYHVLECPPSLTQDEVRRCAAPSRPAARPEWTLSDFAPLVWHLARLAHLRRCTDPTLHLRPLPRLRALHQGSLAPQPNLLRPLGGLPRAVVLGGLPREGRRVGDKLHLEQGLERQRRLQGVDSRAGRHAAAPCAARRI